MSRTWLVTSAGTRIVVEGPDLMGSWWPMLSAQIPGSSCSAVVEVDGPAALALADETTVADTRRMINARLHAEHLRSDTLSLHGVALWKGGRAVLLMGGHGAGKSLTGLAMITTLGWAAMAGDTCLVRVGGGDGVQVIGGTSSYVVRRCETARSFPSLCLPGGGADRVELAGRIPGHATDQRSAVLAGIAVVAAVGEMNAPTRCVPCTRQVAANAVYRASGHLINKVLDDPVADPLSLVEGPELACQRLRLVRQLVAETICCWLRGTPHEMAAAVDDMARDGGQR